MDQSHYVVPRGRQIKTQPIPAGTRLQGVWLASKTYAGDDFSSTTAWGDQFSREGRFTHQEREQITVNGRVLEKPIKNHKSPSAEDKSGYYEFNGNNLVLKYDNGVVHHLPTFTLNAELKQIWFRGGVLSQDQ
jgi:hypothetical protein